MICFIIWVESAACRSYLNIRLKGCTEVCGRPIETFASCRALRHAMPVKLPRCKSHSPTFNGVIIICGTTRQVKTLYVSSPPLVLCVCLRLPLSCRVPVNKKLHIAFRPPQPLQDTNITPFIRNYSLTVASRVMKHVFLSDAHTRAFTLSALAPDGQSIH